MTKLISFHTRVSPKDAEALHLVHQAYKDDGVSMSQVIAAAIKLYIKQRLKPEEYSRIYGVELLDMPLIEKPKNE